MKNHCSVFHPLCSVASALMLVSALFSCQQTDISDAVGSNPPSDNKTLVRFDVSAFTTSVEPFAQKAKAITRAGDDAAQDDGGTGNTPTKQVKDVASHLDFLVFYGNQVAYQAHQSSTDDGFGSIEAALSPGDYSVVCIAHNGKANATITTPTKATFPENRITDTFSNGSSITVGEQPLSHPIRLQRDVACFRLVTTDKVPDDVAQMKFYYLGGSTTLNPQTHLGTANSTQTVILDAASQHGSKGTWDVYTFPKTEGASQMVFQITALDSDGKELYRHNFTSVPMQRGCRTIYTGAFFGGSSSDSKESFSVVIANADWSDVNEMF